MPDATQQTGPLERLKDHPGRGGCGVGAVADPHGPDREVVEWALSALRCMEHRGGTVAGTGDGAGLLLRTPRAFFESRLPPGRHLRPEDHLSVGVLFFPPGEESNLQPTQQEIDFVLRRQGLAPLGWRRVPVQPEALGPGALRSRKDIWQVFVGDGMVAREALPRAFFRVKQQLEHHFRDLYVASLSAETLAYKAMATGEQLLALYPDLADPALTTDLAVFHRRYSTNTFSNWYLAQPFRLIAHNGEINTIKATRGAVRNLEAELGMPGFLMHQGSDSADLDRIVELLTSHGIELLEALVRILPAAWADHPDAPEQMRRWQDAVRRAMGGLAAWEGPAAVVATDGRQLVGLLDRMGLRPLRWVETHGGRLVLESEMGAVPVPAEAIAATGQLDPGEAIALDLREGVLVRPDQVAARILERTGLNHDDLSTVALHPPRVRPDASPAPADDERALVLFGWTRDRVKAVQSMARDGKEPMSSMGFDRPLAVFDPSCPPLSKYLRQIIAVVTNPPIDPIREGGAMDLSVYLGRSPEISEEYPEYRIDPQYRAEGPFLRGRALRGLARGGEGLPRTATVSATFAAGGGAADGKAIALAIAERVRDAVSQVLRNEADILLVSDRELRSALDGGGALERLPLPGLLLVSALHQGLIDEGLRRKVSIVVESGEIQEAHDAAVYLANGADALHPWLFFEVAKRTPRVEGDPVRRGIDALEQGLARILSKMGITTLDGYRGSRLFEAVGLSPAVVDYYLPGVTSRLGGIELADIHADVRARAAAAAAEGTVSVARPEGASIYRKEVWHSLQLAARGEDPEAYGRFLSLVAETPPVYLRDLLRLAPARRPTYGPREVSIGEEEVAPAEWVIATTFRAAAMSHGALHRIAHRAIAAAFNRFGARSNSGEGGEDPRRDRDGPWSADRSRIRQVASGRFGVDARYLTNADELEIKIGQGAKPGEGGHLPGAKVTAEIALIRRTREGVTLISPPPHHDIYSIEDLAQLCYDLRQINPSASIGVKVPTVTDIGTIVVGVVKAGADVVTLSGAEGGTGAAAASSIEHAGLPLERGLAEVHQALSINGIRDAVVLRVDGGIKTGEDVVKLLALGADEVALGTALMIAEQCVFCHGCAKGNCPAGITTQNEEVARRLMQPKGKKAADAPRPVMALQVIDNPADDEESRYLDARAGVERYLLALASDVRRHLARLGLRTPAELVGRVDLLEQVPTGVGRADRVDLTELLVDPTGFEAQAPVEGPPGDREAPSLFNRLLLESVHRRLEGTVPATGVIEVELPVSSEDRAVAATLAGEVAAGRLALPPGGVRVRMRGAAGQALGFGLVAGLELHLEGYANDSVGEAMSGGRIVVRRPASAAGRTTGSIAGNALGYGMTGGELFVEGRVGQRLGVRCSDGLIVCEGAGKYAFEYMTGGEGVVLGPVGSQVGSGMTGGTVYLLDVDGRTGSRVNADARVESPTEEEAARLRALVEQHLAHTGSPGVALLLEHWEATLARIRVLHPAV